MRQSGACLAIWSFRKKAGKAKKAKRSQKDEADTKNYYSN